MSYGTHFKRGLGAGANAMGGAAQGMGIHALFGEGDMVTVFDDFDVVMPLVSFGAASGAGASNNFEDCGWTMADVGAPVADEVSIQDPGDTNIWCPSCLRIAVGTDDNAGGHMQLNMVTPLNSGIIDITDATNIDAARQGRHNFPHLYIPSTAAGGDVIDGTVWVFACRIGLRADLTTTAAGDWDSKAFIGWVEAGDVGILTAVGGAITQPEGGPLVGFHIPEDGSIDGISQRTVNTAYVEGTNFTELHPAGAVDGTIVNGTVANGDTKWWDLAVRLNITDQSDNAANGFTEFFSRPVPPALGRPGAEEIPSGARAVGAWVRHPTVLLNQTPNNNVALVPAIEVVNGPSANADCVVLVDWWAFGCSRLSRLSRAFG